MTNKEEYKINQESVAKDNSINIREILAKYAYHWPVFALGILICLIAAFFYLRYAEEIYDVNSTLLIKDEKKGGMSSSGDILNDLDIFGGPKVVDNEIEILKSKTLMRKVVERLNLIITFRSEGRVINSDIYSSKPVNIIVVNLDSLYGKTLNLSFPTNKTYLLEDQRTGKKNTGELNQLQRNDFGVYKIETTKNFASGQKKELNIIVTDPEVVIDQCLKNLDVTLASKQSAVLNLNFQTGVIQKGKDILNTLIQVYNEAALTDKNKTTQSTIDFIDERLKLISGELTDVEKDVEGFKSNLGLTDISSEANLYLENVKSNDAKLNEINLQISAIKDIQRYINSETAQEKLPSTLGINDPVLLGQITKLSELQLQRDQLLATTTSSNPLVEPLIKQIETTRAGIKSNIENIYSSLENTKKELKSNDSQFQGSIKKIPGQERQLISIKRQQNIKESLYLYLLQKKEEAALSYASAVADSRVVDAAFAKANPVKPKRSLTYLMALILGVVMPIGYVYGKDLMNNKVTSTSEISKLTSTPVLGELFYEKGNEAIVVEASSRKAIAEQFRAIRTNLQFVHGKRENNKGFVTLLTSSMSGEGKSFVGSNIAAALAIAGKKTVLLELDLRKPKVSKYLNLNNKLGLSNYLIGRATLSDIIQPSNINSNLMVIGSGPVPPNPSELLIGDEIEELFTHLRENFDEIIVDTPPIGLVTDAQILSRLSDATIYVVRHGVTFKHQITQVEALYASNKFKKLNIIHNGIQIGGQGYGYGYGYGYYSDDVQEKSKGFSDLLKGLWARF